MNGAILLTLLVPTQAPADPAPPQPPAIVRPVRPQQKWVAVPRPAPIARSADVRAVTIRQTRLGSRQVRLESRPEPPVVDGEIVAPPPPPPEGMVILRTLVVAQDNFDDWVFTVKQDDRDRLAHLQMRLRRRIEEIEPDDLDPAKRRKLELAGAGDIRRFLDRVEAQRAEFERTRQDYESGMLALEAALPLAEEFGEGPFGAGSLFAKTLAKIGAVDRAADPGKSGDQGVLPGRHPTARP